MSTADESETTLLRAAWVASMVGPPIRDAAVVFERGVIVDVGAERDVKSKYPEATVRDLGNVLLTPGLVNAHTHLELSDLSAGARPDTFAGWLISLMERLMSGAGPATAAAKAVATGVDQCLRFGVTTVADITGNPTVTRPGLAASPLRAVSFGEVRAMAGRRGLLFNQLSAAIDSRSVGERFAVGVSPHAPYTVEPRGYETCLTTASQYGLMLTTHLAETPDEATFLRDHSGPLREVWNWRGGWDDEVPTFDGGPIRFAKALGLIDAPTLLAHVNYCDDDELALLAHGNASVAYCPRTHAHFSHAPHRWREMLANGINVCVGTDSCASSPDLNLLDDLRLLRRLAPEIDSLVLWQMATWRGANAIGLGDKVGLIRPGMRADLVTWPVGSGDDPLSAVLEAVVLPSDVWINGRRRATR